MKNLKIGIALAVVLAVMGYLYMSMNSSGQEESSDSMMMEETGDSMEAPAPGSEMEADEMMVKDDTEAMEHEGAVQLNASNFTYEVDSIEVSVGEELVIKVTNDSGTHDFVIDELDINTGLIPVGETVEVVIPTDKAGTFEYYCSVGKHRDLGMKGTLVIK